MNPLWASHNHNARLAKARELGASAGTAAGSWVVDGNTKDETLRAILRADEEGDPTFWDAYAAPLSGEWADAPTAGDVLAECGASDDLDASDEILTAYEQAHSDAWSAEVIRSARASLPDPEVTCDELAENGSCIHSDHMTRAGL